MMGGMFWKFIRQTLLACIALFCGIQNGILQFRSLRIYIRLGGKPNSLSVKREPQTGASDILAW